MTEAVIVARVRTAVGKACPPEIMGIGPIAAVPKALARAGRAFADIDLIDLNEVLRVSLRRQS